jgi:hypothetical protein
LRLRSQTVPNVPDVQTVQVVESFEDPEDGTDPDVLTQEIVEALEAGPPPFSFVNGSAFFMFGSKPRSI